jgi:hypothetical protein
MFFTESVFGKVIILKLRREPYENWTDFVPVGNTEKIMGANYEQLLMSVFLNVKVSLNTLQHQH